MKGAAGSAAIVLHLQMLSDTPGVLRSDCRFSKITRGARTIQP